MGANGANGNGRKPAVVEAPVLDLTPEEAELVLDHRARAAALPAAIEREAVASFAWAVVDRLSRIEAAAEMAVEKHQRIVEADPLAIEAVVDLLRGLAGDLMRARKSLESTGELPDPGRAGFVEGVFNSRTDELQAARTDQWAAAGL